MKTYKATPATERNVEIKSVTCDVCEKTYNADKDILEFQEIICLDFYGGYASVFGDMSHCTLDICQHCLKEKLGQFIQFVGYGDGG